MALFIHYNRWTTTFILNITKSWQTLCLTITKKTWVYFTADPGKIKNKTYNIMTTLYL